MSKKVGQWQKANEPLARNWVRLCRDGRRHLRDTGALGRKCQNFPVTEATKRPRATNLHNNERHLSIMSFVIVK